MNFYQLKYKFIKSRPIIQQEKWRQTQFNMLYRHGRPIFNVSIETQHIRSHINPYFQIDTNRR
jgi:hypothetical protein